VYLAQQDMAFAVQLSQLRSDSNPAVGA